MKTATIDQIRQSLDREEIVTLLELAGFACYDDEPTEQLIFALAEHAETEEISLDTLTLATEAA